MNIFHRQISFAQPDPLDNGLGDEIVAERQEADAFQTLDDVSGDELTKQWNAIVKDIEKDPSWFDFHNE